jgi:hypothetical protein
MAPAGANAMSEIKSAYEKAMEKVAKLSAPTKDEKLQWAGVPKGQRIAAGFLQKGEDPVKALSTITAEERPYALRGAIEVLTANIQLPHTEAAEQTTKKAVEGVKKLLHGKRGVDETIGQVNYVIQQFKTYGSQQLQQAYGQLRQQFQMQLEQQMAKRGVPAGSQQVAVEQLPEFQQEVLRLKTRLEQQYEGHLDNFRRELRALT